MWLAQVWPGRPCLTSWLEWVNRLNLTDLLTGPNHLPCSQNQTNHPKLSFSSRQWKRNVPLFCLPLFLYFFLSNFSLLWPLSSSQPVSGFQKCTSPKPHGPTDRNQWLAAGSWWIQWVEAISGQVLWERKNSSLAPPIPAEPEPAPLGSERNQPFHHLSSLSLSSSSLHQSVSFNPFFLLTAAEDPSTLGNIFEMAF